MCPHRFSWQRGQRATTNVAVVATAAVAMSVVAAEAEVEETEGLTGVAVVDPQAVVVTVMGVTDRPVEDEVGTVIGKAGAWRL